MRPLNSPAGNMDLVLSIQTNMAQTPSQERVDASPTHKTITVLRTRVQPMQPYRLMPTSIMKTRKETSIRPHP